MCIMEITKELIEFLEEKANVFLDVGNDDSDDRDGDKYLLEYFLTFLKQNTDEVKEKKKQIQENERNIAVLKTEMKVILK